MDSKAAYKDFLRRFKHLIGKNPHLIKMTLSNIFTMRLIGNKTHGDLAEVAIAEFINQYMYDFRSVHVGKSLFRAKEHEEDINIINEIDGVDFPISLKAYGDGPLQLSTDKTFLMFPKLQSYGREIVNPENVLSILGDPIFGALKDINVLPLIYNERERKCNVLVFNSEKASSSIYRIALEEIGKGRKHPVYRFYDRADNYICEVRYGGTAANALQRGLWTHTKNALHYFDSLTDGWIDYADNMVLVQLFSHALVASQQGHYEALKIIKNDIEDQKRFSQLGK